MGSDIISEYRCLYVQLFYVVFVYNCCFVLRLLHYFVESDVNYVLYGRGFSCCIVRWHHTLVSFPGLSGVWERDNRNLISAAPATTTAIPVYAYTRAAGTGTEAFHVYLMACHTC